jgi:hypothetical protein
VENGGSFPGTIRALDLLIEVADGKTKIIPGICRSFALKWRRASREKTTSKIGGQQ